MILRRSGAAHKKSLPGLCSVLRCVPSDLSAVGITNQRETTVVWDRRTGKPVYNAIVWQDTRVADTVNEFSREFGQDRFREKTGLPLTTYFSSLKIRWILEHVPGVRERADAGDVLFGNIDTFLVWHLTGGSDGGLHVTDVTNASRTQLMNLNTLDWDPDLLSAFEIPRAMLPRICSSSEVYGTVSESGLQGVVLAGILGDQQAALVGQTCFRPGEAKNTYGTGCFLLMNVGPKAVPSKCGLLTTLGYKFGDKPAVYALEGSVAITGALVQWLRDNLEFIDKSSDIEGLAASVDRQWRSLFCTGLFRFVCALLEGQCSRGHCWTYSIRDQSSSRSRCARSNCVSDPRSAGGHGERLGYCACFAPRRRWNGREQPADAVPGRHSEPPRCPAYNRRNHGAGCGLCRWPRGGRL